MAVLPHFYAYQGLQILLAFQAPERMYLQRWGWLYIQERMMRNFFLLVVGRW